MADTAEDAVAPPFSPFAADIITAQFDLTRQVTDRLIDSLQHQLATERARNDAIIAAITALCSHPYTPNPIYIRAALHPSDEDIAPYLEAEQEG
jgi:hypothetical protein